MSGLLEDRVNLLNDDEAARKDVNAAIRRIMLEMEAAALMPPEAACHPYMADERRRVIVRTLWQLYRRLRNDHGDTE